MLSHQRYHHNHILYKPHSQPWPPIINSPPPSPLLLFIILLLLLLLLLIHDIIPLNILIYALEKSIIIYGSPNFSATTSYPNHKHIHLLLLLLLLLLL
jgi:hypothetical protein